MTGSHASGWAWPLVAQETTLTFSTLHSTGSSSSLQATVKTTVSMSPEVRRCTATSPGCHWGPPRPPVYSLEFSLLLRENSDAEVSVFVGLEGGRDDEVLARWQREAAAHLAQVDEGLGARSRGVALEEVAVEVDTSLAAVLKTEEG